MIAIPLVKHIPLFGLAIALALAAAATAVCVVGFIKAANFANDWGGSGMSTAMMIITPILTGGVWASFIWAGAFKELYATIGEKLGLTSAGASGAGGGGAGGAAALGVDGADTLANPLIDASGTALG